MADNSTLTSSEVRKNPGAKGKAKPKGKAKAKGKKRKRRKSKKINLNLWIVVAVITAVAVFIAMPYLKVKSSTSDDKGAKVPTGYYCYGIDISKYQPDVSWHSLKVLTDAQGRTINSPTHAKNIKNISYVFIKATEGTSHKDKYFRKHWRNAGAAGIRRGAYHFFRSSKDAGEQAWHFINTVGKLSEDDLPPVLDIETIHRGCSRKTLNDKALTWLRIVEEHYGRKPIVYSSASFLKDNLSKEILENYPIWVAHYGAARPRCDKWHIWQFADDAVVYGIDGEVDLNVTSERMLRSL